MIIYKITQNTKPKIGYGKHDDHLVAYAISENKTDKKPITTNDICFGEFKNWLSSEIKTINEKSEVPAFFSCTFNKDSKDKSHNNALVRHWVTFDFDENGVDFDKITKVISKYVFIAWTSYSSDVIGKSGVMNTKRYKIIMPLAVPVINRDWGDSKNWTDGWMMRGYVNWCESNGFGKNDGVMKADISARTFAQYQVMPAINPMLGELSLWVNDGEDTTLFDAYKAFPRPLQAHTAPAKPKMVQQIGQGDTGAPESVCLTEGQYSVIIKSLKHSAEWRNRLSLILLAKPELTGLNYAGATGKSYKILTIGLVLMGFNYEEYKPLYNHFVSNRATPSKDCYSCYFESVNDVKSKHNNYHWGSVIACLSDADKMDLGLIASDITIDDYRSEIGNQSWIIQQGGTNVDITSIPTDAKIVILSAPPGSGKTYGYSQLNNAKIVVPSTGIRMQSGSNNSAYSDKVITYEQAYKITDYQAKDLILVIDEAHQLGLIDFRPNALDSLTKTLKKPWKQIVFASATITSDQFDSLIADVYPGIATDKIIKIKFIPEQRQRVDYSSVICAKARNTEDGEDIPAVSVLKAAMVQAIKSFDANKKFILLLDDVKELEKIKKMMDGKGIKTEIIKSADTQYEDSETAALVSNTNYNLHERGLDGILTTRIACEGINIRDTDYAATVIVCGFLPYEFVYQLSGRFRNAAHVSLQHIVIGSSQSEPVSIVELECNQRIEDRRNWYQKNTLISYREIMADLSIDYADGHKVVANMARDGYTISPNRSQVVMPHYFAQLFSHSSVENNKFYKGLEFRAAKMADYGCNIVSNNFVSQTDCAVMLGDETYKLAIGFAMSARKIDAKIAIANINEYHHDNGYNIRRWNNDNYSEWLGEYADAVQNIIRSGTKMSDEAVMALILRVIHNSLKPESITALLVLAQSEFFTDLREKYPVNTFISSSEQNTILTDFFKYSLDSLTMSGYSEKQAYELLTGKEKIFGKIKPELIDGNYVIDSKQPSVSIAANGLFVLSGSKQIMIKGNRVRGSVILA